MRDTLPLFPEPTYRVSELAEEIRTSLGETFATVWVSGEVQRLRASRNGHLFFELVEKGQGDTVVGKLEAVLWRLDHQRVRRELAATGQSLADGVSIRCRVSIDFYGPAGRLQLVVREVDPVFALGRLAQRRRETLAVLAAAGLLDRNRGLDLPSLPLRIGLVTSHDSAAYHDFVTTLRESGFPFRLLLVHASVQGVAAEREVRAALRWLGRATVDAVALVRGGGARSDLAAFDSRAIAEAVAGCPVPVLTGLGHEIDESVADRVAHSAFKTPTKVAEFLVRRVEAAEVELREVSAASAAAGRHLLRSGREQLERAERGLRAASTRLGREHDRLGEMARLLSGLARQQLWAESVRTGSLRARLVVAAPRRVPRQQERCRSLGQAVVRAARGRVGSARQRADALGRLSVQLSPQRTLARGFSITRNERGQVVRAAARVSSGDRLQTRLADGTLWSVVEEP